MSHYKSLKIVLLMLGLSMACSTLGQISADTKKTNTEGSTSAWVALGRQLFADQSISDTGDISCASCHSDELAFTDDRDISLGRDGRPITRNAPSLIGLREGQPLFWDGRRDVLEEAVLDPLFSPHEHALLDAAQLEKLVSDRPQYRAAFSNVLNNNVPIAAEHIAKALVTYLRSLPSAKSHFDQWRESPEVSPLSGEAQFGFELFSGRAGCVRCHIVKDSPALFTDDQFHAHDIGTSYFANDLSELMLRVQQMDTTSLTVAMQSDEQIAALGRFLISGEASDIGAFRTPSLRNVALTAPYMHDGSIDTLTEAVTHELYYSTPDKGAGFSREERDAIVAFLEQLSDVPHLTSNDVG